MKDWNHAIKFSESEISYRVDVGNDKPVEVVKFDAIKPYLVPEVEEKDQDNSIFLGNGFNMSLQIATGYKQLSEGLLEIKEIQTSCPNLKKELEKEKPNLEELLSLGYGLVDESQDNDCTDFARKEFFQLILRRSILSNKKKLGVMDLLADFKWVFTTNYDPVLYRLVVAIDDLYEKIKRVCNLYRPIFADDSGRGDETRRDKEMKALGALLKQIDNLRRRKVPLRAEGEEIYSLPDSLLISELVHYMVSFPKPDNKTKSLVKDILAELPAVSQNAEGNADSLTLGHFIGKPYLEKRDGFYKVTENKEKKLKWAAGEKQNIFYLHGAFHIHKDAHNGPDSRNNKTKEEALREPVYKLMKKNKESLHTTLSNLTHHHISVFQNSDKQTEIEWNSYLQHCYEKLRKIKGPLCIIGWQCADNDKHLADAINNCEASPIFVSVFRPPEKQRKYSDAQNADDRMKQAIETIQNYYHSPIPNERLVFFDVASIVYKSNLS